MKRPYISLIVLLFCLFFSFSSHSFAANNDWVNINGTVTYNGSPVCAMVLANGQYMFSCSGDGSYSFVVPLDDESLITLFAFVDGLAPFKKNMTLGEANNFQIMMSPASQDSPEMTITYQFDTAENPEWVKIKGNVRDKDGTPLCAMVLANGQYMFSCAGNGEYELEVPIEKNGQITLFGFVDGFQPFRKILEMGVGTNLILNGPINQTTDYSGDIKILGEVKNVGNVSVNFVKIRFDFYGFNDNLIDTDFTYIDGSCMTLALTDSETDTVLKPNEVGAFKLYTYIDASLVKTYLYSISFETYEMEQPEANLVVIGNITTQEDYSGDLELLGTVKNTGTTGLIFGKISFAIKNAAGLIIDSTFTYIDGKNVYLPSIDSWTDTALDIGDTGTFHDYTLADYDDFKFYYYKTSWTDAKINNNIVSEMLSTAYGISSSKSIDDDEIKTRERDSQIENQRIYIINLLESNQ